MKRRKRQSKPHYQLVTILGLLVKTGLGIGGQVWVAHDLPQVREKASVGFERVLLEPQPKPRQVCLRSSRGGGRSLAWGLCGSGGLLRGDDSGSGVRHC